MGVKGLASWLAKEYPDAFVAQADDARPPSRYGGASASRPDWARPPARDEPATAPSTFDCVYIDTASVLHTALRKGERGIWCGVGGGEGRGGGERRGGQEAAHNRRSADPLHPTSPPASTPGRFAKHVFARLDALLSATRPRSVAVLALDGPAPLAKLLTQRQRRRRAGRREARKESDDDDDDDGTASSGRRSPSSPRLSSLSLTPGTDFMAFVAGAAQYYVCSRLASNRWRGVAVELSGADVPGEGEVKCVGRLVSPWSPAAAAPGATHCLVGGDSDLLLMAAAAAAPGAVFVMVDDPRGRQGVDYGVGGGGGRGGGRGGRGGRGAARARPRVFSVAALDSALARALGPAAPSTPAAAAAVRRDLALLAVATCGNDYLPPLRDVTLGAVWRAYIKRARAAGAPGDGAATATPPSPAACIVTADAAGVSLNPESLADVLDRASKGGGPAPSSAPPDDDDDLRPPADAPAYAAGLAWVLAMYVHGVCVDYRFAYDARGPCAAELISALRAMPPATTITPPTPPRPPLPPALCVAALLPPGEAGADAAPPELKPLWCLDPASPVADLYTVCTTCDELSASKSAASRQILAAIAAVREAGEEKAKLKAAMRAHEDARTAVRAASAARRAHMRATHPYAPFPLDRLEVAVTDALGGAAVAAAGFGVPSLYWRPTGGRPPSPLAADWGAPAPLPAAPGDRMPELDPVRPPVTRVALPLTVPAGGGVWKGRRVGERVAPPRKGGAGGRPPPGGDTPWKARKLPAELVSGGGRVEPLPQPPPPPTRAPQRTPRGRPRKPAAPPVGRSLVFAF